MKKKKAEKGDGNFWRSVAFLCRMVKRITLTAMLIRNCKGGENKHTASCVSRPLAVIQVCAESALVERVRMNQGLGVFAGMTGP